MPTVNIPPGALGSWENPRQFDPNNRPCVGEWVYVGSDSGSGPDLNGKPKGITEHVRGVLDSLGNAVAGLGASVRLFERSADSKSQHYPSTYPLQPESMTHSVTKGILFNIDPERNGVVCGGIRIDFERLKNGGVILIIQDENGIRNGERNVLGCVALEPNRSFTFGRSSRDSDGNLLVPSRFDRLSREHITFAIREGKFFAIDNSTNGTELITYGV